MLMTAMATGGDTAAFGGHRSNGCCGGTIVVAGCTGSSCSGTWAGSYTTGWSCSGSCYGSSCHGSSCYGGYHNGCCGGSCHGARPSFFGRMHGHGHSCSGSSCHGCTGSSCYGFSCFGSSCYGGGVILGSTVIVPATEAAPALTLAPAADAVAKLVIELPASAKLYVDGNAVAGDSATRAFNTPALVTGQTYYYDVKAEIVVGGKTVVEEKRIVVRARETSTATFAVLNAAVATKTSSEVAAK